MTKHVFLERAFAGCECRFCTYREHPFSFVSSPYVTRFNSLILLMNETLRPLHRYVSPTVAAFPCVSRNLMVWKSFSRNQGIRECFRPSDKYGLRVC